jgi:hypothetical protein
MFRQGETVPGGRGLTTEIGGRDRFKFFKRPVVPTMEGGTQTLAATAVTRPVIQRSVQPKSQIFQSDNVGASAAAAKPRTLEKLSGARPKLGAAADGALDGDASGIQPQTCDASCQTMFRESDCQTDPYTPDYFVEEGQQPEVLAIMELRYGDGLPAGLGEVEMIDRVQRRKLIESQLPQGSDPVSMKQRLQALEALEKLEWDEREAHIKSLQDTRLKQMEGALHRREEILEEESRARVESLKNKKLKLVEEKLRILQEKRFTATRKLTAHHANPCCEKEPRDIVKSHVLYGPRSKPVINNSLVEKINANNYDIRPTLLSFPEGLQELERTSVPKLEAVRSERLVPPEKAAIVKLETNYQKRLATQVVEHLEYSHKIIEDSHTAKAKVASIQDLYRATPRLQRPDTPTLALQGDDEETKEEAVLLLQRLLRGRAVQNDFYEGKERCHGLIEELQSASNARDAEYKWVPEQQRELFLAKQEAMVQSVVDGVEGDVILGALDYLFKELTRQQEAAKVDQLRDLAEATRREREAQENNKRAEERQQRRKEEEQYAEMAKSLDTTIDTYLHQLVVSCVRQTAATQALQEEYTRVVSAPPVVEPPSDLEREELVCQLLDNVVIPAACYKARTKSLEEAQALSGAAAAMTTEAARL